MRPFGRPHFVFTFYVTFALAHVVSEIKRDIGLGLAQLQIRNYNSVRRLPYSTGNDTIRYDFIFTFLMASACTVSDIYSVI